MKIIAAIAPEQEDVIERILRHLRLWDPPWKRQRKARGKARWPPRAPSTAPPDPPSTVAPIPDDDTYSVDPPGADDASQ
jgi:hypothetical protein